MVNSNMPNLGQIAAACSPSRPCFRSPCRSPLCSDLKGRTKKNLFNLLWLMWIVDKRWTGCQSTAGHYTHSCSLGQFRHAKPTFCHVLKQVRKPENLTETHTDMRRTSKSPHREQPEVRIGGGLKATEFFPTARNHLESQSPRCMYWYLLELTMLGGEC